MKFNTRGNRARSAPSDPRGSRIGGGSRFSFVEGGVGTAGFALYLVAHFPSVVSSTVIKGPLFNWSSRRAGTHHPATGGSGQKSQASLLGGCATAHATTHDPLDPRQYIVQWQLPPPHPRIIYILKEFPQRFGWPLDLDPEICDELHSKIRSVCSLMFRPAICRKDFDKFLSDWKSWITHRRSQQRTSKSGKRTRMMVAHSVWSHVL